MAMISISKENEQSSRFPWPLFILLGEMFCGFACFISFSGFLDEVPHAGQRSMQLCALAMAVVLMVVKASRHPRYLWVWPCAFLAGMFAACSSYNMHSLLVALISVCLVHGTSFLLCRKAQNRM
jgi:hypothetical protein